MTGDAAVILIVEDEPPIRRLLRATLGANDYRVLEAATGAEALSALRHHRPDLVLLDLGLPDIDGLQLIGQIRKLGPVELVRCGVSYCWAAIKPKGQEDTFEAWVSNRFGKRLYQHFFKTYSEKLWGVPASSISEYTSSGIWLTVNARIRRTTIESSTISTRGLRGNRIGRWSAGGARSPIG